ncbi:hypothetical protein ACIQWR_05465 [Streptomyces sp. NPDC098789]|uniref:hypothetical protein n=1 Tax=Streptomyces sp. NPDC098789 TaxID=3366098 RepID=UPI0038304121
MFEITIKDRAAKYQGTCSTRRVRLTSVDIALISDEQLGRAFRDTFARLNRSRAEEPLITAMVKRILEGKRTH